MAFLFKSKKNNSNNQQQQQQNSALPAATRNVHTSEGAPSSTTPSALNGVKDRESGLSQTPTPSSSYNNSLSSVANPSSPDLKRVRQRADSESQVRTYIKEKKKKKQKKGTTRLADEETTTDSTTTFASYEWHHPLSPNQSQCLPLSLVPTPGQLFVPADEPVSSIRCGYQLRGVERRGYLYDGWSDRRGHRQRGLVDDGKQHRQSLLRPHRNRLRGPRSSCWSCQSVSWECFYCLWRRYQDGRE